MRFPFKTLLHTITVLILLTGCGSMVKEVEYAPTQKTASNATSSPVKFSGLELLLPPGSNIGNSRSGSFCLSPNKPVNRNIFQKEIDQKFLRQAFHDALESNGYDVTGSLDIVFDREDEDQRAEYAIMGKLKEVQMDMCETEDDGLDWITGMPGQRGEMYVSIDWSVYDLLRRKVVYETATQGYTERRIPNPEGMALLFHDAFEMAAHNLASDNAFHALTFKGVTPILKGENNHGKEPRLFDADEDVHIVQKPLSKTPFGKTAEHTRNAVVTIEKETFGSGFFITKQGHILTTADVVGNAHRIRVVTNHNKTGLTAEILRLDKMRNVAVLKLEKIPEWLQITTLPVRLNWPKVGEDIYAIGVPNDSKRLKGTVTKGIVSAHRRNFKFEGLKQNFIQGDVEVHGGNSGGPLLDEYGNIVGISVHSYNDTDSTFGNGLNLFIPIQETLDRLGIAY